MSASGDDCRGLTSRVGTTARIVLAFIASVPWTAEASAQSVIRKHWGPFFSGGVTVVRGMDDVDGDGIADYMSGRWLSAGTTDPVIKVYAGANGALIYGIFVTGRFKTSH